MTQPMVPVHQFQGPATNCVIRGKALGWLSCTAYSMAMLIDRATLGAKRPSGCDVRWHTGDIDGGLRLSQVAAVAEREYGVDIEVRVGSNVCSPTYAAGKLRDGHPVLLQGDAIAMVDTRFRTTAGSVNHAVLLNDGRGWHLSGGVWVPSEVRVGDPAAGGQRSSWGTAPKGFQWWPWALVLEFAAKLRPSGDSRILGPGRWYAGIGPDTEPHAHLAFRGIETTPMPERFLATAPTGRRVNVRSGPSTQHPVVFTIASRHEVLAFQYTPSGEELNGSRRWFGDHSGTLWVHDSGLRKP
jgi:hypothetical protein